MHLIYLQPEGGALTFNMIYKHSFTHICIHGVTHPPLSPLLSLMPFINSVSSFKASFEIHI